MLDSDIKRIQQTWLLRLSSYGFVILVNKHTNEYKNFYTRDISNLHDITASLDKHPILLRELKKEED